MHTFAYYTKQKSTLHLEFERGSSVVMIQKKTLHLTGIRLHEVCNFAFFHAVVTFMLL